jgi:hypothetical protein
MGEGENGREIAEDKRLKEKVESSIFFIFSHSELIRPGGRRERSFIYARMAELVDALVSNTSGSNTVPVRSRLRVQKGTRGQN